MTFPTVPTLTCYLFNGYRCSYCVGLSCAHLLAACSPRCVPADANGFCYQSSIIGQPFIFFSVQRRKKHKEDRCCRLSDVQTASLA